MTAGQAARVTAALDAMLAETDARREVNRQRDDAVGAVTGPLETPDGQRYAKLSRLQRRVLAHLYAALLVAERRPPEETGPGRTYDPAAGGLIWNPTWLLGQELKTEETIEAEVARDRQRRYTRDAWGRVRLEPRGPRMPTAERTAASRALLRLVDRGLVERRRSGGRGGQRTYVQLTPEGRALAEVLLEQATAAPEAAPPE